MRFRKSWALVLPMILILGACQWLKKTTTQAGTSRAPTDERKNTLNVGTGAFPAHLDTTQIRDLTAASLEVNVFEGLVAVEFSRSSFEFVPRLAKTIHVSPDGLDYEFELIKGLTWSDGQPLMASHFVDAFELLLRPAGGHLAKEYYCIKNARAFHEGRTKKFSEVGVSAVSDTVLKISLSERENFLLNLLYHPATYPIRKEFVGNINDWARLFQKIPTIGPFIISQVETGKKIVLERNPKYPFRTNLESVVIEYGLDPQIAAVRLSEGKLDAVVGLPQDRFPRVQAKTIVVPSFDWTIGILGFNVKQRPFDNPIVRRTLGMAINREEMLANSGIHITPFASLIPPGYSGFESNRGIRFDPTAAATLLRKSGSGDMKKYLPMLLKYEDRGHNKEFAENAAQQLKRNLDIEVEVVGTGFNDKVEKGQPPTLYLFNIEPFIPDPQSLLAVLDSGPIMNLLNWKNKNYSEFVRDAGREKASKNQARLFSKAQHVLLEKDVAIIPIYLHSVPAIFGGRVRNIPEASLGAVHFSQVAVE